MSLKIRSCAVANVNNMENMDALKNLDPSKVGDFLDKIDEIESIVKSFRTGDDNEASEAMRKADELIKDIDKKKKAAGISGDQAGDADNDEDLPETKTGFNKTVINKVTDVEQMPGQNDVNYEGMDQAGFMSALEADAKERAKRRAEKTKLAEQWKDKGNVEFRSGNYEKALEYYTEGLREAKDLTALYTNRAQTYIKLGKYENAFLDCEWALKCFPNCIKAHIHMGRAHMGMKEWKEARECFQKALTCDLKKQALIDDYLAEVDRAELADQQELTADETFKEGNPENLGVVEILTRVRKPDQLPVYYSGGLRVLKTLMLNTTDKTLLRTQGGMDLLSSIPTIHRCWSASPKSLSGEEMDMLATVFDMYLVACSENDKNTEMFLQTEGLGTSCLKFLGITMKGQGRILQQAITHCLFSLSQSDIGRKNLVELFDIPKVLSTMFTLMRTSSKTATTAANLLSNLALDKKFKSHLRDKLEESVCPSFEKLLQTNSTSLPVLSRCVTMVTNLTTDTAIRTKLMQRKELWDTCTRSLTTHAENLTDPANIDLLESLLGLLLNLSKEPSPGLKEAGPTLCARCLSILNTSPCPVTLRPRCVALLSHVLPHCDQAVELLVEKGGVTLLLGYLKENEAESKAALKAMTAVTKVSDTAKSYIVDNKGLGQLIKRLQDKDEAVVGNAALCLSHCAQGHKVCAALTNTDIIKELLVLARDGRKLELQQNCAILIAKLAQGDQRHLERLRELHGIEILHSCMKHIK
ncbi:tetratricopeptide repeat protein 12-like [Mya arenaria]|uniref:tetratricopeptide repeat protein 12-like n=1 Tax=Mya arenaria TaxID=6604 RepID=UPI0022E4BA29|nr:tetratricopeptide repeat protein 12-like [Mya arenaria]